MDNQNFQNETAAVGDPHLDLSAHDADVHNLHEAQSENEDKGKKPQTWLGRVCARAMTCCVESLWLAIRLAIALELVGAISTAKQAVAGWAVGRIP